jgi:iron complex transport system ATP-binding protein
MILIKDVSLTRRATRILEGIELEIPKGGVTALVGPNGAGKSTLLSLIARLQPLQTGSILVDGLPVDTTPSRELARTLAILRQDPGIAGRLRVRELIGFGRFPHNRGRTTDKDRRLIELAIARFDLADLADRFIDTLSGGQRQRALVAMVFCQGTDYLLLDEPLNNLDMFYARELMRSLRRAADEERRTVIVVLHDINQAAQHADRIIGMRDGRIVAHGAPADIVTSASLLEIFGYQMRVEMIEGRPLALHHI